jgi:hypothetical protein
VDGSLLAPLLGRADPAAPLHLALRGEPLRADVRPYLTEACALATNATQCPEVEGVITHTGDDSTTDHPCSWDDGGNIGGNNHGGCTLVFDEAACEGLLDGVEYIALTLMIALTLHTAWISNSYALAVEQGMGAELNDEEMS